MEKYQGREFTQYIQAPTKKALEGMIKGTRAYAKRHGLGKVEVLQRRQDPDGGWEAILKAHNWNPIKWLKSRFSKEKRTEYSRERETERGEKEEERRIREEEKAQRKEEREEAWKERKEKEHFAKLLRIKAGEEPTRGERAKTVVSRGATLVSRGAVRIGGEVRREVGEAIGHRRELQIEQARHPSRHHKEQRDGGLSALRELSRPGAGLAQLRELSAPRGLSSSETAAYQEIRENDDIDTKSHIVSEMMDMGYSKAAASRAINSLAEKGVIKKAGRYEGESVYEIHVHVER